MTEKQILNRLEYEQRIASGERVGPFTEIIDLENLVGSEIYEAVEKHDKLIASYEFSLRGVPIKYFTPNLRSLWQSAGQEYIEPKLLDFIDNVPQNGVYFDVGASTGVFAIYAAMIGKTTICFEPEITNFNILNINSYLNHSVIKNRFLAFNLALSNKNSIDKIYMRHFSAAAHEKILGKNIGRGSDEHFSPEFAQNIVTLTLDEFCKMSEMQPTDIKIDIDGGEDKLISGMIKTLESPVLKRVFIEVSERDPSSINALATIKNYGFEIYDRSRVQNYFNEYNYILKRT